MPCTQKTTYMPQCPRTLTCMHMSDALRASIYPYARAPPPACICIMPSAQVYTPMPAPPHLHAYVLCSACKYPYAHAPLLARICLVPRVQVYTPMPPPPHLHTYILCPACKYIPLCPRPPTCKHMFGALRASIYPYAHAPLLARICLVPRVQVYTPMPAPPHLHLYVWCPARNYIPPPMSACTHMFGAPRASVCP